MKSPAAAFDRYLARPTRRRLERVVRDYHGLVWRAACRVTRHADDAEDICQDVFLKLLLEPPPRGSVRSPERYLIWQVLGRAANLRRARERRVARETAHVQPSVGHVALEDVDALEQALAGLPDELRGPIELRYLAGLSTAEAAAALGIAERTVEDRVRRGREALRTRLASFSAGAVAFFTTVESWFEASPPPQFLGSLLRLTRMGSALAAATSAGTSAGGAAGKTALIAGAALLLAASGAMVVKGFVNGWDEAWPEEARILSPPADPEAEEAVAAAPDIGVPAGAGSAAPSEKANVTGVVRDDDGMPVPDAVVRLAPLKEEGAESVIEAVSDTLGEFSARVPDGGWAARARKNGFLQPGVQHMYIREGQEGQLSLRLCRPRRLSGQVLDASESPIKGAELWVQADFAPDLEPASPEESPVIPEGGERWVGFTAGEDGGYDTGFTLAVMNTTEMQVLADGFCGTQVNLWIMDFIDGEARIDFVLEREMPISVRVLDPAGKPVEGAEVGPGSADSWSASVVHRARTDSSGRARLRRLRPSSYGIRAEKESYRVTTAMVSPGASTDVLLVLEPIGPGVRGRITFDPALPEDARGVEDVVFEVLDGAGEFQRLLRPRGRLDPETREFIYWPDPGRYRVRIDQGLLSWSSGPIEYTGLEGIRADIHAAVEHPYVSGTVVRAGTGEPVGGVGVLASFVEPGRDHRSSWGRWTTVNGFAFHSPTGNKRATKTGADGKFLLLLPRRGSGNPFFSGESTAELLVGSRETGWAEDVTLELDAETTIEDLRIELRPTGSVEGMVKLDGLPANRALVVASDIQGTTLWTQSDREGRYRIDGLRAGSYLVLPLGQMEPVVGGGSGGAEFLKEVPPPHEIFDRPVPVNPGEVSRWDLDLEQDGPGRIEGTVADELRNGNWISYGLIIDGIPRSFFGQARGNAVVRNARFEADFILPGRFRASLFTEFGGDQLAELDFDVSRGHVTHVHLEPPRGVFRLPIAGGASPEDIRVCRVERLLPAGTTECWAPFATVEEPGLLRVERLPEGKVALVVSARGHVARTAGPFEIVSGVESLAPALELEPGEEIRIRASAEGGHPIAGEKLRFEVRRTPDDPPIEHTLRCEGAGKESVCVLSAFAPGRYRLTVDAGAQFAPAEATVDVPVGQAAEVEIELHLRR